MWLIQNCLALSVRVLKGLQPLTVRFMLACGGQLLSELRSVFWLFKYVCFCVHRGTLCLFWLLLCECLCMCFCPRVGFFLFIFLSGFTFPPLPFGQSHLSLLFINARTSPLTFSPLAWFVHPGSWPLFFLEGFEQYKGWNGHFSASEC